MKAVQAKQKRKLLLVFNLRHFLYWDILSCLCFHESIFSSFVFAFSFLSIFSSNGRYLWQFN